MGNPFPSASLGFAEGAWENKQIDSQPKLPKATSNIKNPAKRAKLIVP